MDMWVSHAMRKRNCILCTHQIMPGDEVMVSQWKKKFPWGMRTNRQMSHFECYISRARTWLEDHPYTPTIKAGPGRPVKYTPAQVTQRKSLQTNILRWGKKQEGYVGDGMWEVAKGYGDRISKARDKLKAM